MTDALIKNVQDSAEQFLAVKADVLQSWRSPCSCENPGTESKCLNCPWYRAFVRQLQLQLSGDEKDLIPALLPPLIAQPHSEEVRRQCIELYSYGYSLQDIQWITGLRNLRDIRKWLRQTGQIEKGRKYSSQDKQACFALYQQGVKPKYIEEQTGIPADLITKWFGHLGLSHPKRQYTETEKQTCIELYLQGNSVETVAEMTGIPRKAIYAWKKKAGVTRPRIFRGGRSPVYSQEFKQNCMELLRQGKTPTEVARTMDIPADTVRQWQKKLSY